MKAGANQKTGNTPGIDPEIGEDLQDIEEIQNKKMNRKMIKAIRKKGSKVGRKEREEKLEKHPNQNGLIGLPSPT